MGLGKRPRACDHRRWNSRSWGHLEVRNGERVLPLGTRQQTSPSGLLAPAGERDDLARSTIEALWGEEQPRTAAEGSPRARSTLRAALEPARAPRRSGRMLATRGGGYELRIEPEQLDLGRFELLRAEGREELRNGEPERASDRLREALGLWRGLRSRSSSTFPSPRRRARGSRNFALPRSRIGSMPTSPPAGIPELTGELEAPAREHPLREGLRSRLMLALVARTDRQRHSASTKPRVRS